jgi:2-oxoacid:acceptor oxidoreductase delta subunit (pyruvate/2-ketoisovalerate family)
MNMRDEPYKPKTWRDLPYATISDVPSTFNNTGTWRTVKPVINYDKCISCMLCWKFCPDVAISIVPNPKEGAKFDEVPKIDYFFCKGCGICAHECPVNAIDMVTEESK